MTKIKLPKFNDIHIPSIKYDINCSFIQRANFKTAGNEGKEIKYTLWFFCISLHPFIDLIKKKEKHYNDTLERLLEEDIPFASNAKESQALRYKRALAGLVPAFSGLATIAIESLSSYLQKEKNKVMAKGLKELKRNPNLPYNKLNELVNYFLLYEKYNAKNTEKIVLTIHSLQNRTSRLEGLFLDIKNEWPSYYLCTGIGCSVFSYQLQLSCSKLVISGTEHLVAVVDKLSTTTVVFFRSEGILKGKHLYGA